MSSTLSTEIGDEFDTERFQDLFLRFGLMTLASLALSIHYYWDVSFRTDRAPSFVAMRSKWFLLRTPYFTYHLPWLSPLIQFFAKLPLLLILIYGIIATATLKPRIVGLMVLCLGLSFILGCYGVLRWRNNRWRMSSVVRSSLALAFLFFMAFQLLSTFISPYSFFGISTTYMALNLLWIVAITFEWAPGIRVDFRKLAKFRDLGLKASNKAKGSEPFFKRFMPRGVRTGKWQALYAGSVLVLLLYSLQVYYLIDDSRGLGFTVSVAVVVLDVTAAQYATLAWSGSDADSASTGFHARSVIVITTISRALLISFGRYWLVGMSVQYLIFGVVLAAKVVTTRVVLDDAESMTMDQLFHRLRKEQYQAKQRQKIEQEEAQRLEAERKAPIDPKLNDSIQPQEKQETLSDASSSSGLFSFSESSSSGSGSSSSSSSMSSPSSSDSEYEAVRRGTVTKTQTVGIRAQFYSAGEDNPIAAKAPKKVRHIVNTPEFALGLLSVCFSLLIFVVAVFEPDSVPLDPLDVFGEDREQYIFGLAALCFVLNCLCFAYTVANYVRHDWIINNTILAWAGCTIVSVAGTGYFLFVITGSWLVLNVSLFGGVATFTGMYSFSLWASNGYEFLDPPRFRNPPMASLSEALPTGLPRRDLLRVASAAAFLATLLLFGWVHSLQDEEVFVGWAIVAGTVCIISTAIAIIKWFATLRVGFGVVFNMAVSTLVLCGGGLIVWTVVLDAEFNEKSLALLFLVVSYPSVIFIGIGTYTFYEDHWRFSPVVRNCYAIAGGLMACFIAATFAFVSVVAAVGVLVVACSIAYAITMVWAYFKNDNYLPKRYRRVTILLLSIMASFGLVVGFRVDSENASFIGFSASWACLFLGLVVVGSTSTKYTFYSRNVFPVLVYDPHRDTIRLGQLRVISGYAALFVLLVWGVATTIVITPYSLGTSVTSIVFVLLVTWTADLRQRSSSILGLAYHLLERDEWDKLMDSSFRRAGKVYNIVSTDDKKKRKRKKRLEQEMRGSGGDSDGQQRDDWRSIETADTPEEIDEQIRVVLREIEAMQLTNEHKPAHELMKRREQVHRDVDTLIKKELWRQSALWSVEKVQIPNPYRDAELGGMHQPKELNTEFFYNSRTGQSTWVEPEEVSSDKRLRTLLVVLRDLDALINLSHWQETKFIVHVQMLLILDSRQITKQNQAELREFMIGQGYLTHAESDITLTAAKCEELIEKLGNWKEERAQQLKRMQLQSKEDAKKAKARKAEIARRLATQKQDKRPEQALRRKVKECKGRFEDDEFTPDKAFGDGPIAARLQRAFENSEGQWLRPPFDGSAGSARVVNEVSEAEVRANEQLSADLMQMKRDADNAALKYGQIRDPSVGEPRYLVQERSLRGWISPNDVIQGSLGDCYFLSALSVMAAQPHRIAKLFVPLRDGRPGLAPNEDKGAYIVRFWKEDQWRYVLIDDSIPCVAGQPNYVKTRDRSSVLWPILLEKAYAKLHASFENIEGGQVSDALVDLSGPASACEEITLSKVRNMDAFWAKLKRYLKAHFLMGAHSPEGKDTNVTRLGIVKGHAYSILTIAEEGEHRLVQLRNPHGDHEWKGAWSDNSSEWTPRLRRRLGQVDCDDGIFWMALEDLLRQFRTIYVCRLFSKDAWSKLSCKAAWRKSDGSAAGPPKKGLNSHKNPQFLLTVKKDQPAECFFSLQQKISLGEDAHPPASIKFFIVDNHGKKLRHLKGRDKLVAMSSAFKPVREVTCDVVLEPKPYPYTIMPCTVKPGQEADFTMTVYSNTVVSLRKAPQDGEFADC